MSSLYNYSRRISQVVNIGNIGIGGVNPIRIQSMTNTPTLDTLATVEQCMRTFDKGADIMRITTPGIRDAENLSNIKKELQKAGYYQPLVADVHFNPKVAEVAARIVSKVRINPGNYVDSKKFEQIEYTEKEYKLELERIHERILPLLKICKEHGTAIRVGVNHGSLSDRIISKYGDTPQGMVESAMEFLKIFEAENFTQSVISMKSSNTRVMVYSTRLLVNTMLQAGMNYPVHLGVTEAGEGEDGIIKSAVGIGTLLTDGIGETIRVSLTGDPEQEIPVAQKIVNHYFEKLNHHPIKSDSELKINQFDYQRRKSKMIGKIGGTLSPKVCVLLDGNNEMGQITTIFSPDDIVIDKDTLMNVFSGTAEFAEKSLKDESLILSSDHINFAGDVRRMIGTISRYNIDLPIIFHRKYQETELYSLQIKAACDFGPLLIDGYADGIWLENEGNSICSTDMYLLSLNLLQASRLRMSKTEYISCPSCGRTLFDLSSTTAKIRERTSHLKHLKIGIMGCIVNGPGEMADADYGYVGSGVNKITLYKNKNVVKRNISEDLAVDELIALIKECGDWKDKV